MTRYYHMATWLKEFFANFELRHIIRENNESQLVVKTRQYKEERLIHNSYQGNNLGTRLGQGGSECNSHLLSVDN